LAASDTSISASIDASATSAPISRTPYRTPRETTNLFPDLDEVQSGSVTGAAVGASLGALAAIAALVLLFLLLKKKKNPLNDDVPCAPEADSLIEPEDGDRYISEYGLSDGGGHDGKDDAGRGTRRTTRRREGPEDENSGASEHNPEEMVP
jgi:hypothetical protein